MTRTVSTFFNESGQDKHPETSLKWYLLTMELHNQLLRYNLCLE